MGGGPGCPSGEGKGETSWLLTPMAQACEGKLTIITFSRACELLSQAVLVSRHPGGPSSLLRVLASISHALPVRRGFSLRLVLGMTLKIPLGAARELVEEVERWQRVMGEGQGSGRLG